MEQLSHARCIRFDITIRRRKVPSQLYIMPVYYGVVQAFELLMQCQHNVIIGWKMKRRGPCRYEMARIAAVVR